MKEQLDREWQELKSRLLNAQFINEVESVMQVFEVRMYEHGKVKYNEWDLPQEMVSLTRDPAFKTVPKYYFTGMYQWKTKEKEGLFSKRIILFSSFHNSACVFDLFQK